MIWKLAMDVLVLTARSRDFVGPLKYNHESNSNSPVISLNLNLDSSSNIFFIYPPPGLVSDYIPLKWQLLAIIIFAYIF
jgi:hypothetical protein